MTELNDLIDDPGPPNEERVSTEVDGLFDRIKRISDNASELGEDFSEWAKLKLQLVRLDIESGIRTKASFGIFSGAGIAIAALGGLLLIPALCSWFGYWLGHPGFGYAVISLLLMEGGLAAYLGLRAHRVAVDLEDSLRTKPELPPVGSQKQLEESESLPEMITSE